MSTNEKKAYDIETFCRTYSIGRTRLYKEIKDGRLRVLKVGRRTIITADAAEQWVQALAAPEPSTA